MRGTHGRLETVAGDGAGVGRSRTDGKDRRVPAARRYYYAAYQAVTALLLYRGLTPPTGREAWSHEETPTLLQDQLQALIRSRDRRNDLADRLAKLYRLRLIADYKATRFVVAAQVVKAGRDARFILRVADEKLPRSL